MFVYVKEFLPIRFLPGGPSKESKKNFDFNSLAKADEIENVSVCIFRASFLTYCLKYRKSKLFRYIIDFRAISNQ